MRDQIDWVKAIQPLLKLYKGKAHPLEFENTYQLIVEVMLSSQVTDELINDLAPALFKKYPDWKSIAKTDPEAFSQDIIKVRSSRKKSAWLNEIAQEAIKDKGLSLEIEDLVQLKGVGRKSANVIRRGAGLKPQGIIVDLHTLRVAPRLGITDQTDADKIEKDLMEKLPQSEWDAGMAMSFHGREICRPQPKCEACIMRKVCRYYKESVQ